MDKWVSVNDECPEMDGEFLVCIGGDVTTCEHNPWIGQGENSYRWFEWQDVPNYGSEKCELLGVTHWMPLPEPPKE
ncbi:MAG: hypothetical protein COA78_21290 [Blastopirellula sp.]|nr:MAG: hypothetical protein COA78_21290 [Blastopirellula sp.]